VTQPRAALWAAGLSYGLVPLLGWGAAALLGTLGQPDLGLGLLIVTAVPCTLTSATVYTRLAGGHDATALLVTFLTTSLSWLITPAWLALTAGARFRVDLPDLMAGLFLGLVAPVALGQLARWPARGRGWATRGQRPVAAAARALILVTILQAAVLAVRRWAEAAPPGAAVALAAAAALAVHLTAAAVAYRGGALLGLDRPGRVAATFAGSQKTLPISLLLIDGHFRAQGLAVLPALAYHVGQLIVDTWLAEHLRGQPGPS
jgi:sodium/bile acid cotransporter 7